jgi:hypothetical protein
VRLHLFYIAQVDVTLSLCTRIRDVLSLNLGGDTGYAEIFLSPSKCLDSTSVSTVTFQVLSSSVLVLGTCPVRISFGKTALQSGGFEVFLSPRKVGIVPWLEDLGFLPSPFQFIIHQSSCHSTQCSLI